MRFVPPFTVAAIAAATVAAHAGPPPELARSLAEATPAPALASGPTLAVPIAFAVNVPFAWPWSLAFSGWVGVDAHHAIRANYARYRGPLLDILSSLYDSE